MAAKAAADKKAAAMKANAAAAYAQASSAKRATGIKDSRSYREIYNSIPFSRAEYDANPGYRHQATMEIMLGQLHPIIVAPPAPPWRGPIQGASVRFPPSIYGGPGRVGGTMTSGANAASGFRGVSRSFHPGNVGTLNVGPLKVGPLKIGP